jgi:hypothetical protein
VAEPGGSNQEVEIMTRQPDRRALLPGRRRVGLRAQENSAVAQMVGGTADLILFNDKITTLDRQNPETQAIAISADRFVAAGAEQDVMRLAGPGTQHVDLKGRHPGSA